MKIRSGRSAAALVALLVAAASGAAAADKPEVYSATAELKTIGGVALSTPVTISIDKWTSDADRDTAKGALAAGGTAALQKAVGAMPAIGYLQVGKVRTPIHFARALPVGDGKVVTVATAKPVFHIGAGAANAKPKAGYDVAMVIFEVNAAGAGDAGDFAPAAKVKFDDKSGLQIEDYGVEAIRLMRITRK
jgi:hypothetical protein